MIKKGLNGIRGVMALAIVLSHCGYLSCYKQTEAIGRFCIYLYGAVTFFFILSGYFFEYTRKEEIFQRFILRKMKKIYPLHICTLICSLIILLLRGNFSLKENAAQFLINLFLLQSWIPAESYYFSFNAVSWFLSSLLACYILAYYIQKQKTSLYIVIVGYILQILLCIFLKEPHHWLLYINPILRFVDFCLGICICQRCKSHKKNKRNWIYTAGEFFSICLFVGTVYTAGIIKVNLAYNFIYIVPSASIITLFSIENGALSKIFSLSGFQNWGSISMELFMTHKFIINNLVNVAWFKNLAEKNVILSLLLILCCCFVLALSTQRILIEIRRICYKTFTKGAQGEIRK